MQFIPDAVLDNLKVIRGCCRATVNSLSNRFSKEIFQFLPSISFFVVQAVTVFSLFRIINGIKVPLPDLLIFIGLMICVDGCGDAIFLAGINEYCSSLVRGQTIYFLLTPGVPLFKIFFFRVDTTKFSFCAITGLVTVTYGFVERGSNPLLSILVLMTGILTHMVLTSAFHIIQAYWDPTRPIRLGSPATRFYTRPIHLVLHSLPLLFVLLLIYPAYFATAFPSIITTKIHPINFPFSLGTAFCLGMFVLLIWGIGLNHLVKKTCVKYQN